jgi:hypothetical protein
VCVCVCLCVCFVGMSVRNVFHDIPALYIYILPHLSVYLQYFMAVHSSALHIYSTALERSAYLHAYMHAIKY